MKSQQTDHLFHHQGALLLALTSILGKSTPFLSSDILTAVLTFLSPSTAQTSADHNSEGSSDDWVYFYLVGHRAAFICKTRPKLSFSKDSSADEEDSRKGGSG